MKKPSNPIAFTPLPVTIITSVIYAALIIALLVTNTVVPPAPSSENPVAGINLTEAWLDLQTLSEGFHPYNSRRNDLVRNWLLTRIESILNGNKESKIPCLIFNDLTTNVSFGLDNLGTSGKKKEPGTSAYFEGTNIIVYIHGTEDGEEPWSANNNSTHKGGVLVNAHYDSVSTGFGATDDGVGVVSVLQLIKHFTTPGQQPKRGIVALLNNGEEDGLNGARAFVQHPISKFPKVFLNLEGAGAGGRATLFRSTDSEVTKFYKNSPYPFGTIISSDGFNRGFIRSQTDYVIFNGFLSLRGLDVSFFEPRARYHTEQDDARHTSKDSLWHMLSAALATMGGLTADTSNYTGKEEWSQGVWFDLFGRGFALLKLRALFALSVTLLVVSPLILVIIGAVLYKVDRFYLFKSSQHHHHPDGDDKVSIGGLRGFFRYPIIFILAAAANVGLAFLVTKTNPYIVFSSPFAIWAMMLSAWLYVVWFLSCATDFARPSAFHRLYTFFWMFIGGWLVLVAATMLEDRQKIGGVYFLVVYLASIFISTSVAFLELFRLPRKSEYASATEGHEERPASSVHSGSISSSRARPPPANEQNLGDEGTNGDNNNDEATESTSLLQGERQPTFAHYMTANRIEEPEAEGQKKREVYGYEQPWSFSLPRWTWLLQFLIVAPITVILVGQIGLLLTSGTYQTLSDGNSPLSVYLLIAVIAILILLPLGPFLHRYTYHIPTFLLLVFIGTLIYNLVAFPFSSNNRLKLYFLQTVDLDTGINEVALSGVRGPYLSETIGNLQSSAGKEVKCSDRPDRKANIVKEGLVTCSWEGLAPRVVPNAHPQIPPETGYTDWLSFNVSRDRGQKEARFHLFGRNTRACKITFNRPISDFTVDDAGSSNRFRRVPDDGSKEIRLWSRTWEKPWDLIVKWEADESEDGDTGLDGRVVCLWSDDNDLGVIPALDEIRRFAPVWVGVTKAGDGLVEGSKAWMV